MTLAREAWRPAGEFGEQPVDDLPDKERDCEIGLVLSPTPSARLEHDRLADGHRPGLKNRHVGPRTELR